MKRHHIVAAFLLICGGLFAYIRFENGDTNGAIRTGIIFTLLAIINVFSRKIATPAKIPWSKSGCPNFLGNICLSGFHGWGYRKRHYTGYPDDFRDSP